MRWAPSTAVIWPAETACSTAGLTARTASEPFSASSSCPSTNAHSQETSWPRRRAASRSSLCVSAADYHATFGPSLDADRPLGHAVDLFFANGGQSAVVVRAAGPASEHLVPADGSGGLHALASSGVTVLALPGLTAEHPAQVRAALAWCAAYRAVLLLDLPAGPWTSATATLLSDVGEHAGRAAAYHPWVVTGGVGIPPSGAVAGVVARTDRERGVWKAPAGVALHGVDGLVERVGDGLTDELTRLGVNPLREFPGRVRVVWGARTLAAAHAVEPGSATSMCGGSPTTC